MWMLFISVRKRETKYKNVLKILTFCEKIFLFSKRAKYFNSKVEVGIKGTL